MAFVAKRGPMVNEIREVELTPCQYDPCPSCVPDEWEARKKWIRVEAEIDWQAGRWVLWFCSFRHMAMWALAQERRLVDEEAKTDGV